MVKDDLAEAKRLAESRQYKEAALLLKSVIQGNPDNSEAKNLLAEIQDRMMLSMQVQAKVSRARSLADSGDKTQALTLLKEILRIDPENAEAEELQRSLSGETPPAASTGTEVPSLPPEEPDAFQTVSMDTVELLPEGQGEVESPPSSPESKPPVEELPDLSSLDGMDLEPQGPAVEKTVLSGGGFEGGLAPAEEQRVRDYIDQGRRYFGEGKFQEAIDSWTRVFIVDEENQEVQGLIDEAKEKIVAHQKEIDPLLSEGIAAFNAGKHAEAKALLEKILAIFPNHREALYYLNQIKSSGAAAPQAPEQAAEEPAAAPPQRPSLPKEATAEEGDEETGDEFELESASFPAFTTTNPQTTPPTAEMGEGAPPSGFSGQGGPQGFELETGAAEDFSSPPPKEEPVPGTEEAPATFTWDEPLPPPSGAAAEAPAPAAPPAPSSVKQTAPGGAVPEAPARTRRSPALLVAVILVVGLLIAALGIFFGTRFFLGGTRTERAAPPPSQVKRIPPKQAIPKPPPPEKETPVEGAEPPVESLSSGQLVAKAHESHKKGDFVRALQLYQMALTKEGSLTPEIDQGMRASRAALAKQQRDAAKRTKFLKDFSYSESSFKDGDYAECLRVAWRLIYPDDGLARELGKRDACAELIRKGYYNWAVMDLRKDNVRGAHKNLRDLLDFDPTDKQARKILTFTKSYVDTPPDDHYRDVVKTLRLRGLSVKE